MFGHTDRKDTSLDVKLAKCDTCAVMSAYAVTIAYEQGIDSMIRGIIESIGHAVPKPIATKGFCLCKCLSGLLAFVSNHYTTFVLI